MNRSGSKDEKIIRKTSQSMEDVSQTRETTSVSKNFLYLIFYFYT